MKRIFSSGRPEAFRQHHARRVDALVAGNERVGIRRRVVGGDARARLHLAVGDALVDEGLLDDEIGRVERRPHRRGIAEVLVERDVVGRADGQIGSAPSASRTSVTAGSTSYSTSTASAASRAAKQVLRHHHRDRFARIAHAVGRQRILLLFEHRPLLRREGAELDVDRAGRIGALDRALQAVGDVVRAGQHRDHARHFFARGWCRSRLTMACACGERTNTAIGLSRHRNVVGIAAGAAHEAQVLEARHRPSDVGPPSALGLRSIASLVSLLWSSGAGAYRTRAVVASATGWTRGGNLYNSGQGVRR